MKAAVVPAMHSKWEIREAPRPGPGPNQVLIKIRASGICYTDVHQTGGALPGAFPRILGHEPVGEIVAIGLGVTTRKVGDRKSTRLNSSHGYISYAVFCLKKKKKTNHT